MDNPMNDTEKQIVDWLREQALDCDGPNSDAPTWKHVVWVIFHPKRWWKEYGRFFALVKALNAIERGDHRKPNDGDG